MLVFIVFVVTKIVNLENLAQFTVKVSQWLNKPQLVEFFSFRALENHQELHQLLICGSSGITPKKHKALHVAVY